METNQRGRIESGGILVFFIILISHFVWAYFHNIYLERVIDKNSLEFFLTNTGYIIFRLLMLWLNIYLYFNWIGTVKINENGVTLYRLGIPSTTIAWEDVGCVAFEYGKAPEPTKCDYWMCITTKDKEDLPNKPFKKLLYKKNIISFYIDTDKIYNEIIKYYPKEKIYYKHSEKAIPEDYAIHIGTTQKMDICFTIFFSVLAISACVFWYYQGEIFAVCIFVIYYLTMMSLLCEAIYASDYQQLQINENGISAIKNGEAILHWNWDQVGDVVVMANKYIFICRDEEDVSDGNLRKMSGWNAGEEFLVIRHVERNFKLISKYYPVENMKYAKLGKWARNSYV